MIKTKGIEIEKQSVCLLVNDSFDQISSVHSSTEANVEGIECLFS
jgi:hypothetical protein